MTYKPYDTEENHKVLLYVWGLRQMMRGVGWACAGFVLVIGVYVFLRVASGFLPPESQEAPAPYGSLEQQVVDQTGLA